VADAPPKTLWPPVLRLGVLEIGFREDIDVLCWRVKEGLVESLVGVVKLCGASLSRGVAGCISVWSCEGLR